MARMSFSATPLTGAKPDQYAQLLAQARALLAGERDRIANANRCEYCLAAHTVLGQNAGATGADMAAAQVGRSGDPRTAAALAFALTVVGQRAQVDDADFTNLRTAGFDDGQIVEIMAHVALNLFTNYINVALDVPVDFPRVALK